MVIRGYPEEARKPPIRVPEVEPPPEIKPEVTPIVNNYYYTYNYPTEKKPLDLNLALTTSLIALGVITIGGIIIILISKKK